MSLRLRMLLAFLALIVLGFGALTLFAGNQLSSSTLKDFEDQLSNQARLIARGLREGVEHTLEGEESATALAAQVQSYADQVGGEVTLLDPAGRYWIGAAALEGVNFETLPEVTAARRGTIVHDARLSPGGVSHLNTAAPVLEDGQTIAIVHVSAPLASAQLLVGQRWLTLLGGMLLLTVIAVLLSLWLASSLTRPLAQLRRSALQLAAGDFSQRLPATRHDEIGQVSGAFNHMADQVQAMLEEQRAFASNAAHELRSPLTTIRLRSEALRDGDVDPATARQYIVEIDNEAARLSDLVQDLILLSRLDAGRLEPGQAQIEPLRFARQLVSSMQPEAAERSITLTLDAPDDLPLIRAGTSHLHVVFRNVLANALAYTPPGGSVTWQMQAQEQWVVSVIRDTGQGIAPDDLAHVFERFYRADQAHTRSTSGDVAAGVGLGLSLVKLILDAYGCTIEVTSPGLGQGTAVTIRWPVFRDTQQPDLPAGPYPR